MGKIMVYLLLQIHASYVQVNKICIYFVAGGSTFGIDDNMRIQTLYFSKPFIQFQLITVRHLFCISLLPILLYRIVPIVNITIYTSVEISFVLVNLPSIFRDAYQTYYTICIHLERCFAAYNIAMSDMHGRVV